jgi:hypothetical protein
MTKVTASAFAEIVRADYEQRREKWIRCYGDDQGFDEWFSVQVVSPRKIDQEAFRNGLGLGFVQLDIFGIMEDLSDDEKRTKRGTFTASGKA